MSELYELRRIYEHGRNCASLGVVIPHKLLAEMKITKGDYLKFYLEDNKVWIEKLISQANQEYQTVRKEGESDQII